MNVYFLIILSLFYAQSAYSSELAAGSSTGPKNSRSRLYSEFNTDLYCKAPPKRSQCPSYTDVLKGKNFDEEVFAATTSSDRPCFVNRTKHIKDIADYAGNNSFGRNFAVYSSGSNVFEIDIPVNFYIGGLSGDKKAKFAKFKDDAVKCIRNNPITLHDGKRTLKLNMIIGGGIDEKDKYEKYRKDENYKDTALDKGVFSINLHDKLGRNNIENYGLNIPCSTLVHEALHIAGLHDEYHAKTTYKPNLKEFEKEFGAKFDESLDGEDQNIFDCRKEEDGYGQANIMNYHKLYDVENYGITFNICDSGISVGSTTANVDLDIKKIKKRGCHLGEKSLLTSTIKNEEELKYVESHAKKLAKQLGKKSGIYISYYRRKKKDLPPSLTENQFDSILFPNCLSKPTVRAYGHRAKNAYRSKYETKGPYRRCRKN